MAYVDDLIAQAEVLVAIDRNRPKQANLRRAVSAAYYALFHEIVDRAVSATVPSAKSAAPLRDRLRRFIPHKNVNTAAKWFVMAPSAMPTSLASLRSSSAGAVDPALVRICQAFMQLQQDRHRADYDLASSFVKSNVHLLIADAKQSVATLRALPVRGDTLIFLWGSLLGDGMLRAG